jgi:spore germination cell wall hydrolase CwlJ-like protein
VPDPNQRLLETMARLLYGENRKNLGPDEAKAIIDTTLNRTELRGYPADPLAVIHQPGQYTPFDPSNANYPVIQKFGPDDPDWVKYMSFVQYALQNPRTPYTHYHSHAQTPAWARGIAGGETQIGAHKFLTEPRRKKKKRPGPP